MGVETIRELAALPMDKLIERFELKKKIRLIGVKVGGLKKDGKESQ